MTPVRRGWSHEARRIASIHDVLREIAFEILITRLRSSVAPAHAPRAKIIKLSSCSAGEWRRQPLRFLE
jgi:hypothetical protein